MMGAMSQVEPWLRGTIEGLHPILAGLLYSFEQVSEDLRHWMDGVSIEELWSSPMGLTPVGFQLRHIAGSTDRLLTYALGGQLSEAQLAAMKAEAQPGEALSSLLDSIDATFAAAGKAVRAIDSKGLEEPREVGRKRLPTTCGGLLFHIAEHNQRHVGQAIVTAKLLKWLRPTAGD
jgi:hypothetical protein